MLLLVSDNIICSVLETYPSLSHMICGKTKTLNKWMKQSTWKEQVAVTAFKYHDTKKAEVNLF